MFNVLEFKANAAATRINRALTLTPAHRVALVFPLGQRVSIAEPPALAAIAERARAAQKHVTIVGGDAHLRACAVLAGLAAATTLAEWQASPSDGVPTRGGADHAQRTRPALWVVSVPEKDMRGRVSREEEFDPPAFVDALLSATDVAPLGADDVDGAIGSFPVKPISEIESFAAAVWASEREEEDISDTITETSGIDLKETRGRWISSVSHPLDETCCGDSQP